MSEQKVALIQSITDILSKKGHTRPGDWTRYLESEIYNVTDENYQRFLINRAFRTILGECDVENTIDARYCLVDTGSTIEWLSLFEEGISATLVRLALPPALN